MTKWQMLGFDVISISEAMNVLLEYEGDCEVDYFGEFISFRQKVKLNRIEEEDGILLLVIVEDNHERVISSIDTTNIKATMSKMTDSIIEFIFHYKENEVVALRCIA